MGIFDRLFGSRPAAPPPVVLPRSGVPDGTATDEPTRFGNAELDAALNGEKVYVTSSNVEAFQWDRRTRELIVWFLATKTRKGTFYVYQDVPPRIVTAFIAAPSKGQFVHRELRNGPFLHLGPF
jgi:hypothetical protein